MSDAAFATIAWWLTEITEKEATLRNFLLVLWYDDKSCGLYILVSYQVWWPWSDFRVTGGKKMKSDKFLSKKKKKKTVTELRFFCIEW